MIYDELSFCVISVKYLRYFRFINYHHKYIDRFLTIKIVSLVLGIQARICTFVQIVAVNLDNFVQVEVSNIDFPKNLRRFIMAWFL